MPEITLKLSDTQLRWVTRKGDKSGLEFDGFIRYLIERDIEAHRNLFAALDTISPYPIRPYRYDRAVR